MAGFLNKVILLLPQRTNIARGQMVMVWGEPLVLKMPWFLLEATFENALNFNKIFCVNVKNTIKYEQKTLEKILTNFIIFL